jgi:hypothetical protein
MWKSQRDVESVLDNIEKLDRLNTLYALHMFWANAVYCTDYTADSKWEGLLAWTDYGDQILEDLASIKRNFPSPDFILALFQYFCHHDILLSHTATDVDGVATLLAQEILSGRLLLPYHFGRFLYDKFNDLHNDGTTNHLSPENVDGFLKGTPIGVYQADHLVTGPLGVLHSKESRFYPPTLELPLWHCSDTGCGALHTVRLLRPPIPIAQARREISSYLSNAHGPPSEWQPPLARLHRRNKWPRRRLYYDIVALIGDCILSSERAALLTAALESLDGKHIRSEISEPPRSKRDAEGPASKLATQFSPEEQLQLLMLLPDQHLVWIIDELAQQRIIQVPMGERRRAHFRPPHGSDDPISELSSLGVRAVENAPIVRLTSLVFRAYNTEGRLNELEWRVRSSSDSTASDALATFARTRGPEEVVREFILSTGYVTQAICSELGVPLKTITSADKKSIDILLWKLGFNPVQYDEAIPRLKTRIQDLSQTVAAIVSIATESERERIRGIGVNLFVSIEDFLEQLLVFNVWLLCSDHFLDTKFAFDLDRARQCIPFILGESLEAGSGIVAWSTTGENSLGVLLRYLRASLDWMRTLKVQARETLIRPEKDLPHFADDPVMPFPFRHTAFWADTDPIQLERYVDGYERIVNLLEQAEPAFVRNGLDHHRTESSFPTVDKLLSCAARLGHAVDAADIGRYFPKPLWLMGKTESRYGTVEYQFSDYAGRSLAVFGPPIISGLPSVQYGYPFIMLPHALLGVSNALLAFRFAASSQYSLYWQGYPRRYRLQLNGSDRDAHSVPNDGVQPLENLNRSSYPDGSPPDADLV